MIDRTLGEPVQAMQCCGGPSGDERGHAEVEQPTLEPASPIELGTGEAIGLGPDRYEHAGGHAPLQTGAAQSRGQGLLPGDHVPLGLGEASNRAIGVVHGPRA